MPNITRGDLPPDTWKHRYQIGFRLFKWRGEKPIIFWRTVPQTRFLATLYARVIAQRSHPEDVLAMFHAGYVQEAGRAYFRALRA